MKLQLDTTAKTIKVEESVNLGDLIMVLSGLLPDDLWKTFKLEAASIIYWQNPIVIDRPVWPPIQPYYPTFPWITYDTNTPNDLPPYTITSGTYNIDILS